MKCNKVHKWLALYREGELEDSIRDRLREHLAGCESCNRIYRSYLNNERIAARIRYHKFVLQDEDTVTGRILHAVKDLKKHPGDKGFTVAIDRILDLSVLPVVRRLAVACIVIIATVFVYQQGYIYSNAAKLEKQLTVAGKSEPADQASKDMQDCIKKSERYFSKIKTGQIKIESKLKIDVPKNPEVLIQYASFFCSHGYRYLENNLIEEKIIIPDF